MQKDRKPAEILALAALVAICAAGGIVMFREAASKARSELEASLARSTDRLHSTPYLLPLEQMHHFDADKVEAERLIRAQEDARRNGHRSNDDLRFQIDELDKLTEKLQAESR